MSTYSEMLAQFKSVVDKYGEPVLFTYLLDTHSGTAYDDEPTVTTSGTSTWVQAKTQPLSLQKNSYDRFLLEQGKILMDDRVMFIPGSVAISQSVRFGTGSPTPSRWFSMIGEPVSHFVNGSIVYKKMYVRTLTAGLFIGESGA